MYTQVLAPVEIKLPLRSIFQSIIITVTARKMDCRIVWLVGRTKNMIKEVSVRQKLSRRPIELDCYLEVAR